ncbi:MAG: ubiquinol-cytochrome c reductase cytochrome b subunit, partial [Humibacter sp.]
ADLIATQLHIGLENVVNGFQVIVVLGPVAAFFPTRRICLALEKKDRLLLLHGYETGRIVRLPGGEYVEMHEPVPAEQRASLRGPRTVPLVVVRPDERGRIRLRDRLRARIARAYLEDRIAPASVGAANAENGGGPDAIRGATGEDRPYDSDRRAGAA